MKRMTQVGFVAMLVSAAPAWSQELRSRDSVLDTPAHRQSSAREPDAPVVNGLVSDPVMIASEDLGKNSTEMIETVPEIIEVETPNNLMPSGPPMDDVRRFHSGRCYISELGPPTNSCCMNGSCRSPNCHYCCPPPAGKLARVKAYMQRTHWGYCNYFDERPLGESVYTTLSQQIRRGLEDSLMLYHYDFYPAGSQREVELTPRGRTQLMKIISRMNDSAAPIQIQFAENQPKLNLERRQRVVELLFLMGVNVPDQSVVLARVRHQGNAIEAAPMFENQLQSVIQRGRTIRAEESASFGGR